MHWEDLVKSNLKQKDSMNMPKISIIVPVYRAEAYLHRCVDSILAQTFTDWELLLIDDGSPDKSGEICDEYAQKDSRVRVIHKENGGVSSARNYGINHASGEYLMFVDSDDMVMPGFFQTSMLLLEKYQADFVSFSHERCEADEKWGGKKYLSRKSEVRVYEDPVQKMDKFLLGREIGTMACAKVYHRKLFENIRYPVGKYHEDVFTTYKLVDRATRIVTISQPGYWYRKNPQSIMTSRFSKKRLDSIEGKKKQLAFVKEHYPILIEKAEAGVIYACSQNLLLMAKVGYRDEKVLDALQVLYRKYGSSYVKAPVSRKGKMVAIAAIISVRLAYILLSQLG